MKQLFRNGRTAAGQTEQIRLSEERVKLRVVLFIVALLIAVGAFAYGINALFSSEPGMQEITALSTGKLNCGDDFTFYYYLGAGEASATSEQKAVRSVYSQAAVDAYQLFSADAEFEDCKNLWYINQHINEEISVAPALYQALVFLEESGARYHYLAPVYELHFSLFQCQYDQETAAYDPFANEELRSFCSETTLYTNDADQIRLELLGNNTVRLRISEDYLRFADENGISCFVDLFWMKNAFIVDYIAGILVENGYTHGSLISRDGFIRHLGDMPGTEFAFTLSHRDGVTVSDAETLRFSSAASLVYLRDYPLGDADAGNYYVFEDGTVRFPYIDPADGYCKSAIPELAAVSTEMGCAELVLKLAPLYIADALDQAGLQALTREGIAVYDYS